ncbi:MAG: triacylglycerol lipase [Spirochaetales bacterium]|nr:triacylglycerol lipase [Spirochaetales bacterium]
MNDHPLVLVHGAYGFGREALWGYRYWGGRVDLQQELVERGHAVLTAAVGPVSSNWDRACELYACLAGGRVDYGEAHSRRHGHARYGRTYPGLFPEWGSRDPDTGRVRRVHLVGHSLGGQTARVLVQLLAEGSPEERAAPGESGDLSPLFEGGHNWVASVTTISTPHDGTTATVRFDLEGSSLETVMSFLLAAVGTSEEVVYDFRLDQWGLERRPGLSYREYRRAVAESPVWDHLEDTCLWDASPEGARELNRWVHAQEEVYYLSWATQETFRDPISCTQVPGWGMNPNLTALGRFLGSYASEQGHGVRIDRSWWPNDGLVNTCSMDGPTLGSRDRIVPYGGGVPEKGVWNFMGVLESLDHVDTIGLDPLWRDKPRGFRTLLEWYLALAELLASLPD